VITSAFIYLFRAGRTNGPRGAAIEIEQGREVYGNPHRGYAGAYLP